MVRVLSFHASYGCRHRGRCCSSGWPIEVDGTERTRIEDAIEAGLLVARPGPHPSTDSGWPERVGGQGRDRAVETQRALRSVAESGPALLASNNGRCAFHDDNAAGGCRIHRALGHAALPLACRQFPRQSVRDPRGVSVTLSHYCPTANELLIAPTAPITIVDNAPAFPADNEYVGLNADSGLPPLLHPRLAMDWDSWWAFEELSVSLLSQASDPLPRLALAVEYARRWSVDRGPLLEHVREAFIHATAAALPHPELPASRRSERIADALAAVPDEWRDIADDTISTPAREQLNDRPVRRYLAAHAFANWAAYQGEGLRTWFRAIETAASLLIHTADAGRADLVLRHLADSTALIERWNHAEREPALGGSG